MPDRKTFYITTPIYYPSGKWHLGSAYTTVLADAISRFKRMDGYDVMFLTGTDEHGMKIQKSAQDAGMTPKAFVDGIVENLQKLWQVLDIKFDKFIRTTDDYHKKSVQKIFQKLYDQGDIYKSQYQGLYCVPCESFWTETQAANGKCPDCGRDVAASREESYFFRLSKYSARLEKLYAEHPDFLKPQSRVNEMLNNFIRPGLEDIAVSRNSFKWGVPVPFDSEHVVYVWIDALTNYITALGYGSDDDALFKKFWPCDVHLMAKEIIRFHSIIWPALLMALDVPMPKQIYGHGWLMMGGDKLSKSKGGNIIDDVVDPLILSERYGTPAVRYVLLKDGPYSGDAPYTNETLITTVNSDLANDLGNLLSRTSAMISQYFGGKLDVPDAAGYTELDTSVTDMFSALYKKCQACVDVNDMPSYISAIMAGVRRANKYVDQTMPWALNKTDEGRERLKTVLYVLAEALRISIILLSPVLTDSCSGAMLAQLGFKNAQNFDTVKQFGASGESVNAVKGEAAFPRMDAKRELAALKEIALLAGKPAADKVADAEKGGESAAKTKQAEDVNAGIIKIDDFFKVQLVTAKVIDAAAVEKSDKLLKLTLDIGEGGRRTVVSGIAQSYTPQALLGKNVVLVKNLAPAKLRGIISEGMILCAEDKDGKLAIVSPDSDLAPGSEVR